jgi:MATE family multidrug resistance protein
MNRILNLAIPVIITYLGYMTMGIVDLLMVGPLGPEAIGVVGISTAIFGWFMVAGIGLLSSLEFLVSRSFGASEHRKAASYFVQGLLIAIAVGIPASVALYFISDLLALFGINPEIIPQTSRFLKIFSLGLLPIYLYSVARNYLQAIQIAKPAMILLILANIANALLNWGFVFGHFGFPKMGVLGSALSTSICRWLMFFALIAYIAIKNKKVRSISIAKFHFVIDGPKIKEIWRIGFPSALQMVLEVGVFATCTTIVGRFATTELAAHQIVLNIASLTFMVPLGMSSAAAVLVGQSVGQGDFATAQKTGWQCLALGTGFMTLTGVVFILIPEQILRVYTNSPEVLAAGASIIFIAALFQIFDGVQAVLTGALRGIAETRSTAILNFVGHWLIGLPLGLYLAFSKGMTLLGIWIGLASGLVFVALTLLWVWHKKTRADAFVSPLV